MGIVQLLPTDYTSFGTNKTLRMGGDGVVRGGRVPWAELDLTAASPADIGAASASATAAALALKAPLNSPAFLGTPTAPTVAGTSDNTDKLATTGFVQAVIMGLINSAPGALDTLGELAAQMQADETGVAALTTAVAGKLAKSANLSDLTNPATARSNLGLGVGALAANTDGLPEGAANLYFTNARAIAAVPPTPPGGVDGSIQTKNGSNFAGLASATLAFGANTPTLALGIPYPSTGWTDYSSINQGGRYGIYNWLRAGSNTGFYLGVESYYNSKGNFFLGAAPFSGGSYSDDALVFSWNGNVGIGFGYNVVSDAKLSVRQYSNFPAQTVLNVRGANGQTANLLQLQRWDGSTATSVANIAQDGSFTFGYNSFLTFGGVYGNLGINSFNTAAINLNGAIASVINFMKNGSTPAWQIGMGNATPWVLDFYSYGVSASVLQLDQVTGTVSVNIPGLGLRALAVGAIDSGGSGYRALRVLN